MSLIHLSIAWLMGILLASLLSPSTGFVWLLIPLPLAGFVLWRNDKLVRSTSACGLFLLFGILRYLYAIPHFDKDHIASYNDLGWIEIRGTVSGEPDVRSTYTDLPVAAEEVRFEGEEHKTKGKVLVRAPRYPEYFYGDRLRIRGFLTTPPEFEDFSYREYLARQGIYSLLRRPQITLLARNQGNPAYAALFAFKRRMQAVIARLLPEPQAALLTGILLGVRTGIPASLMKDFNATGTTHIIAISGFNISIIAGLLSGLASRLLGRRRAVFPAITGISLYTIFVGANAAVVRAAVMGSLCLIAVYYGRRSEALTSLAASAMLMTLLNPLLLWDLSFQLSFSATLGLILYVSALQGRLEKWLQGLLSSEGTKRVIRLLNESLIVTVAAQLTTLPLVAYHFKRLSLITLLTNLLILPAQQGVMLWGGLAAALGLIWIPLGQAVAWVAWLFLSYTIRMVELTARFSWASLDVERFGLGLLGFYYGLLALGTLLGRGGPSRLRALWLRLSEHLPMKAVMAGLSLMALLTWAAVASLPDGKLHVAFLDVGRGEAIVIQTPKGSQILVDGGPDPIAIASALGRRLPFWDRTIELMILTDPDEAHLAGLIPMSERYKVKMLIEGKPPRHPTPLYSHWRASTEGIPRRVAQSGMSIHLEEGLRMTIIDPGSEADDPLVLRLSFGKVSCLLAGDIGEGAEARILDRDIKLASTVFKVPSHGVGDGFLNAVRPRLAVFFGQPAPQVRAKLEGAGATVLCTEEHGTIEVVTDGKRLWIKVER